MCKFQIHKNPSNNKYEIMIPNNTTNYFWYGNKILKLKKLKKNTRPETPSLLQNKEQTKNKNENSIAIFCIMDYILMPYQTNRSNW